MSIYERQGKLRYFAIPNGGKRSKVEAAIMKGLGVRAGVPDICVLCRDGTVVFLELKSAKGTTTAAQKDWLAWIAEVPRHTSAVIRDASEVPYVLGFQQRRSA